jgi:hypothetical protein
MRSYKKAYFLYSDTAAPIAAITSGDVPESAADFRATGAGSSLSPSARKILPVTVTQIIISVRKLKTTAMPSTASIALCENISSIVIKTSEA